MDLIERAINEYHKRTCIRFIPRVGNEPDYISIESGTSGCWSSVGRIGGKQVVNLQAPGCVSKIGTVIHEFLHVLGFLHEQNREERDRFVAIRKINIRPGYEVNFDKAKSGETSGFGVPYDYGSVMHYSANAFSKNNMVTIEAKMKTNDKMGQRDGFSAKDVEKVNRMYNCKSVTGVNPSARPSGSILENLLETIFPTSTMDEEEMIQK